MLKYFTQFVVVLVAGLFLKNEAPAQEPPEKRLDQHGDPLPEGAIARLGTSRWRLAANMIAFSPDGQFLAATGANFYSSACLFDAKTGKILHQFGTRTSFASFSADSKTLFTTMNDSAHVWDIATGKLQKRTSTTELIKSEGGKEIRVWSFPAGGGRYRSPDGKIIATRDYYKIMLSAAEDGKQLQVIECARNTLVGKTRETPELVFSPDSKTLFATEKDQVAIWDTATGKLVRRLKTSKESPASLAITRDGKFLASGGHKGTLYLWDLAKAELMHTMSDAGHTMAIYVLAFSPDGKTLATQAHLFPSIRLWDVATGKERSPTNALAAPVENVAFNADGKSVVTTNPGDVACQWNIASGSIQRRFDSPPFVPTGIHYDKRMQVLPGRDKLLILDPGHRYPTIWDLSTGNRILQMVWPPSELLGANYWANASPDEKALLVTYYGDVKRRNKFVDPLDRKAPPSKEPPIVYWTMLGLWDLHAGKMKDSFRVDAEDLDRLTLSGDRKTLAGVGKDPTRPGETIVFVWDLTSGKELSHFAIPSTGGSSDRVPIAVSKDGRTLISGPHHSEMKGLSHFRSWDIATGKVRATFEYKGDIAYPVGFFEGRLAAICESGTIRIFDLTTGKVLREFRGHDGKIMTLAFSADGQRLVSASADTTLLVWDLSRLGAAEK